MLAVLLPDPSGAVEALGELEACRERLQHLSAVVHRERAGLSEILHRLAATGLRPEQLAALSGLPQAEVVALLAMPGAGGAGIAGHTRCPPD